MTTPSPGSAQSGAAAARPPSRRWWVLLVLALSVSLIVIDGTIVNVALPTIMRELPLDFTAAQWTGTLYALVFSSLLLTSGRLGDRYGRRLMLLVGVVVFVIASVMAGAAHGAPLFLAARALQGLGAALVLPSTLSTVNATFTGRDRSIAFAVWGSVISATAAVGPLLGGWLTLHADWRWIFWINVPLVALIVLGALLVVPETRGDTGGEGVDVVGFLLSAVGFGGVVFGLVQGHEYGWWHPLRDLALGRVTWPASAALAVSPVALGLGTLALVAFALWESWRRRSGRSVLLDLSLFRFRSFAWGNVAAMVIALGEFGLLFVLPLYLQNVLGLSPMAAGWVLAAMALGAFVAGSLAHPLSTRLGPARVAQLGVALEAVGVAVLALLVRPETPGWQVALVLVAYGFGLGLCSAQLTSVILLDVPAAQSGQGSATQSTTRQVGSALGVAILSTVLGQALSRGATGALADVVPGPRGSQLEQGFVESAGGLLHQLRDGGAGLPPQVRDTVVGTLSTIATDATRASLLVAAIALALAVVVSLRLPQPGRAPRA